MQLGLALPTKAARHNNKNKLEPSGVRVFFRSSPSIKALQHEFSNRNPAQSPGAPLQVLNPNPRTLNPPKTRAELTLSIHRDGTGSGGLCRLTSPHSWSLANTSALEGFRGTGLGFLAEVADSGLEKTRELGVFHGGHGRKLLRLQTSGPFNLHGSLFSC